MKSPKRRAKKKTFGQGDLKAFLNLLKACTKKKDLHRGAIVHADILKRGLLEHSADALVNMYAKCGALTKAQELLDGNGIYVPRVSSWNAVIDAYVQEGQHCEAWEVFERMQRLGILPSAVTFACILRACCGIGAGDKVKYIHSEIVRRGLLGKDIVLDNTLLDMYAKHGAFKKAQQVLEGLPFRDVVSWTALIRGYEQQGRDLDAMSCFKQMQCEGLSPDRVTFICILKACGNIGAADKGKQIHEDICRQGLFWKDATIGNALVDVYARCGDLVKAYQVLDELPVRDVISWTSLIGGYAQQGNGPNAFNCFKQMQHEGISPNSLTFACILTACGRIGAADKGEQIQEDIVEQGLLEKNITLGNALVDMHAKCGSLTRAHQVFDGLPIRNVVSWNVLLTGYAQEGQCDEALNCFEQMQGEGVLPDSVTFVCALKACAGIGAIDKGEQIYDEVTGQGLLANNIALSNALVDMFSKCGALAKAQSVLDGLTVRDTVTWNALLTGFAQQGKSQDALRCFERMEREGIIPEEITFLNMLNACSHSGLLDDGQLYFANMSFKYGIKPNMEHYTCMVDLFGRAGHLDKAVSMVQKMPSPNYSEVWHAMLGACLKWKDVNIGRWAFQNAMQVDRYDDAAYVLMANIFAAAGMQEHAKNLEALRSQA